MCSFKIQDFVFDLSEEGPIRGKWPLWGSLPQPFNPGASREAVDARALGTHAGATGAERSSSPLACSASGGSGRTVARRLT